MDKNVESALTVLLTITVNGLNTITADMEERERNRAIDRFIASIDQTRAVDTTNRRIFDYDCGYARKPIK
jgi:hypothetical protein